VLAFGSARDALEFAVRAELADLTSSRMSELEAQLERADTNLSTWTAIHTLQDVLIDDQDGLISAELARLADRYPLFAELAVINPSGLIVAAAKQDNIGKQLEGQAIATVPLTGQHYHSEVSEQSLIGGRGVALAYPILAEYDPETVIGTLVGIVDWSRVHSMLEAVPVWGMQQSADRRLLLRTDTDQVLFGTPFEGFEALPHEDGISVLAAGPTEFLVGTARSQEHGWVLHAMISEAVAYAPINSLATTIALISAVVILAAGLLGATAASRLFVRPIRAVTEAMTQVSRREVDVDLSGGNRRDEIGQMLRAIAVFRDNTNHDKQLLQERERALETQNLRFDSALSNMSQGLSMFDAQGRLTVSNPQFASLYGLRPDDVALGTTLESILMRGVHRGTLTGAEAKAYAAKARQHASQDSAWEYLAEFEGNRVIAISHRPMPGGGWVSTHADITEKRRTEARIVHMAGHDALTGLPNRVLLRQGVEDALHQGGYGSGLAVLGLDLDRFKSVNDTLGHPVGDGLLREVAARLTDLVGPSSVAARLGGDEFAILHREGEQPASAMALAQQIIDCLSEPYEIDGHHIVIGTTVGVAVAPDDGNTPDTLLKNADLALYRGKADGGGVARRFEPEMDRRMQERRSLEMDLRAALQRGDFELFYQPLLNLETDEIVAFEALLRWRHPERGLIGPADFIPIAEETGLIVPLGEWVLRQACQDATKWPASISVSVNLSPVQFRNAGLVNAVFQAVAASHLSPTRLDLEITETVLLNDSEATLATLGQLKDLGVRISMDDFGTGYSSLSYLQKFPFNKIKIDQSFVQNLGLTDESLAIIRAVTGMGRSLGISTTAEGVETVEQLAQLRLEGCTEIQGYLISRPQPMAETMAFLAAQHPKRAVG
jgi:diguanylate cyclase (GGDEF)-like protein